MKKPTLLAVFLITLALLLVTAPALADDSYVGNWAGTWSCAGSHCEKTGGTMRGNITQQGDEYGGQFSINNTVAGDLSGPLQAWLRQAGLNGKIQTSAGGIGFLGKVNGNTLQGQFEHPDMGQGTFNLTRQ
jgi:hypothetical protein